MRTATPKRSTAAFLVLLLAGPAEAAEATPRAGAYAVEISLELPHLDNHVSRTTKAVCIASPDAHGAIILPVLSDNNPLASCPATNVVRTGSQLSFDIVCDGANAAKAVAAYTLAPDAFAGRIAMTMGGKNMTMTEVQRAMRIGDCKAAARGRD